MTRGFTSLFVPSDVQSDGTTYGTSIGGSICGDYLVELFFFKILRLKARLMRNLSKVVLIFITTV